MKVPLNWLKEYVEVDIPVEELVAKLTAIGHMQDKKPEKIEDDVVLDLEVRQNRSDCLSILGIAREVAAVTGKQVKEPTFSIPPTESSSSALSITNTAPDLCRRFKAYRIRLGQPNGKVETPAWMKQKLAAYGIKTISPLVDITNFVMIEYGEPMHAFDANKVKEGGIIIRRAIKGEKLVVLGGRELSLTNDDLVIADSEKILSFSGLIGGEESGVNDQTTEVILEAATYNQAVIRRSSLRHAVRTEASTRHEKFLHPMLAQVALDRAAQLVLDICGGEIVAKSDSYPKEESTPNIALRTSEIERLAGVSISADDASHHVKSLGFPILSSEPSALQISVPYWRTDIEQEADLVEEVLRLHGYENIPANLPSFPPPKNITSPWIIIEDKIRDLMLQFGFDEQITEPLTQARAQISEPRAQIILQNALNADKNALRTSLKEGLLHGLNHQKKFGKDKVSVFELGKVYFKNESTPGQPYGEARHFGFMMYDSNSDKEDVYFRAKGIAQVVCEETGFAYNEVTTLELIDSTTVFCSINIEEFRRETKSSGEKLYTSIPHVQKFDISFVVSRSTRVGEIIEMLRNNFVELENIELGEKPHIVSDTSKSVLIKFTLGEDSLVNKEASIQKIMDYIKTQYGAIIR